MGKKLTTEQFIKKAKKVHGDRYDYSEVVYVMINSKVNIVCKIHGIFEQSPYKHMKGQGCKKCNYENNNKTRRLDTEKFIKKAKEIHGNKYDYSLSKFTRSNEKVKILCKEHGEFIQEANSHLQGAGCRDCGYNSFKSMPRDIKDLVTYLRSFIKTSIRKGSWGPKVSKIVGCNFEDFKFHLEDNPYNFKLSDDNIDLDHIVPLINCVSIEDVYKLNKFNNFQLLPSYYNRHIKRCNEFDRKHFEKWLLNSK